MVNGIHKRALKLVYEESLDLIFQELQAKDKLVLQKICQSLATEVLKSKTGVSPELTDDIFHFVERPYNLRSNYTLERKRDDTIQHSSKSFSSLAPKFCDL